jgi:hypothetical protein
VVAVAVEETHTHLQLLQEDQVVLVVALVTVEVVRVEQQVQELQAKETLVEYFLVLVHQLQLAAAAVLQVQAVQAVDPAHQ